MSMAEDKRTDKRTNIDLQIIQLKKDRQNNDQTKKDKQ
jgi:glutaredoxin